MRRKLSLGFVLLIAGFALLAHRATEADAVPAPGPGGFKWEYKVHTEAELTNLTETKTLEAGLNKLGEDGWELVAIKAAYENTAQAKKNAQSLFVLKRLKTGK
jgi:hypothetical protein